jgi:hypothetical protein
MTIWAPGMKAVCIKDTWFFPHSSLIAVFDDGPKKDSVYVVISVTPCECGCELIG